MEVEGPAGPSPERTLSESSTEGLESAGAMSAVGLSLVEELP